MTLLGFVVYLASRAIPVPFAGLFLVMAWPALGLPATFALIGEELSREKRIAGFTLQAVLKRLPIVLAPPLGGLLLERAGFPSGMRIGYAISVVLSLGMLGALRVAFRRGAGARGPRPEGRIAPPPPLWRLLAADILIRLCEGLPDVFIVV